MNNLWLYLLLAQFAVLAVTYFASPKKTSETTTKALGVMALIILAVAMLAGAWWGTNPIALFLVVTCGVWLISISRLLSSKHSAAYVKLTVFRDSRYFVVIGLILLLLSTNYEYVKGLASSYAQLLVGFSVLVLISTIFSLKKYKFTESQTIPKKLPSVTLAIPARNETHALKQSLQAALVSDYQKLEILVLDDCSQDSTAEIIRSFAHDGVRFVQGPEPMDTWIGKNQAYKELLDQASGEIVIFCGVDVHSSVDSISKLVNYFLGKDLKMLSVLPTRVNTDFFAHVLQPVRYFWQLAFPRYLTSTPAAISSLWMVDRQSLVKSGGFDAVRNSLIPEAHLARRFSQNGKYSYLLNDPDLGITSKKKYQSQIDTGIRLFYPVLKRSFALSWLAVVLVKGVFLAPFIGAVLFAFGQASVLYLVAAIVLTLTHLLILTRIAPSAVVSGLITFPLAMIAQILLIIVSAWQYEFGDISWKGRNVCIPALRYNKR